MELLTILISIFIFLFGYLSGSFIGFLFGILYGKFYYNGDEKSGWRSKWFRSLGIWNIFHRYFKMEIIYDEEVDQMPQRAVIGVHPHGLATVASVFGFGLYGSNCHELVRDSVIGAASIVFNIPVWRELGCAVK